MPAHACNAESASSGRVMESGGDEKARLKIAQNAKKESRGSGGI